MAKEITYTIEEAIKKIGADVENLTNEMVDQSKRALNIFAGQALAIIQDRANQELNQKGKLRQIYLDNIGFKEVKASDGSYIYYIQLYKPAGFIEEGRPRYNMLESLLHGPKAKRAKNGNVYNIIPFSHKKTAHSSVKQNEIIKVVNKELKKRGLDKIITRDGKPVLGRAATINLAGKNHPVSRFNKPLLTGLNIYQSEMRNEKNQPIIDKATGKTKIRRDVLTFRTASSSQLGSGLWDHPGVKALDIFDKIQPDLDKLWEAIVSNIGKNLP